MFRQVWLFYNPFSLRQIVQFALLNQLCLVRILSSSTVSVELTIRTTSTN